MNNNKFAMMTKNNFIKFFRCLSFAALFSVSYFSSVSYAQYWVGPVANSLGGAGRAAVDQGEQTLLNPATIAHAGPFASALHYQDGYLAKNEHDRTFGISLIDNSEELLLAGSFTYLNRARTFQNINSVDESFYNFSMGGFLFKQLALGVTLNYLETEERGSRELYTQIDGHIGAHYNPNPDFGVGLVFYNLASRKETVPEEYQNPDSVYAGVYYIYMPELRLRYDMGQRLSNNPGGDLHFQGGIESKPGDYVVFRVGYDNDQYSKQTYYTAGFGLDGPRLKIDYFYRKNTDYSQGALHGVDLRLPFW